jgi:hypothetical protein
VPRSIGVGDSVSIETHRQYLWKRTVGRAPDFDVSEALRAVEALVVV